MNGGGQPQRATEGRIKIFLNPDVFLFRFNSRCFNRGRADTMLCRSNIIDLFGCLRVRMFEKRRRKVLEDLARPQDGGNVGYKPFYSVKPRGKGHMPVCAGGYLTSFMRVIQSLAAVELDLLTTVCVVSTCR